MNIVHKMKALGTFGFPVTKEIGFRVILHNDEDFTYNLDGNMQIFTFFYELKQTPLQFISSIRLL